MYLTDFVRKYVIGDKNLNNSFLSVIDGLRILSIFSFFHIIRKLNILRKCVTTVALFFHSEFDYQIRFLKLIRSPLSPSSRIHFTPQFDNPQLY